MQRATWLTYQPFAAMYCSGVKWFNQNFFVRIFLIQLCSFVGFGFGMRIERLLRRQVMCKSLSYTLNGITAMCGLIISAYYLMPVLSAATFFRKKKTFLAMLRIRILSLLQSRCWQVMTG